MIPNLEKPKVIEIHVRMDCNGCVQKIKKAISGVSGIYEHYIDFPNQKLTVVGWIDPQVLVKALKKARKVPIICSHSEPAQPKQEETKPPQPAELATPPPPSADSESKPAEQSPPNPEPTTQPETQPPTSPAPEPTQTPPQEAPPTDQPPQQKAEENGQPPAENPTPELKLDPDPNQVVEEIRVIDYNTQAYPYRAGPSWVNRRSPYEFSQHELSQRGLYESRHPVPKVSSYMYRPTTYTMPENPSFRPTPSYSYDAYQDGFPRENYMPYMPVPRHPRYDHLEYYDEGQQSQASGQDGNISTMFSDENPNACTIM